MSWLLKIGTRAASWLPWLLSAWHWHARSKHQSTMRGCQSVLSEVPFLFIPVLLFPWFLYGLCSAKEIQKSFRTFGNSLLSTLLTNDFIRPQTVGQLPDSGTSLVSLSILGEISNPRQMQRLLSQLPRFCVSQGYGPILASSSCFPGSLHWPCSNAMLYRSNYLKWCWHLCLISNSFFWFSTSLHSHLFLSGLLCFLWCSCLEHLMNWISALGLTY